MTSTSATFIVCLTLVAAAAACASTGHTDLGAGGGDGNVGTFGGPDASDDVGSFGGSSGGGTATCTTLQRGCASGCTDFPASPVIDPKPDDGSPPTPANAASYFAATDGSGPAPCLVDPMPGTLVPQNWVRPRIRVIPSAGQNLFAITLHTTRQANDYVVYTTSTTWKMPKAVWDGLRADSWGDPIEVTVRAVDTTAGAPSPTSAKSSFTIAPASAGGAMIYWAATGDQNGFSWLEGFAPGDESVATTLQVTDVKAKLYRDQGGNVQNSGAAQCIGCHSAVPDGDSVTFVDFWPWPGSAASVDPTSSGAVPSWLSPGGAQALSLPWLGIAAFSKGAWQNEKVAVTSYGCAQPTAGNQQSYPWSGATCSDQPGSSLIWIDLAAATPAADAGSGWQLGQDMEAALGRSFGFLARTGDTRGAEFPSWSHDGSTVVYVSTNAGKDGRLGSGAADLYTVPYGARMGGQATPVSGASDPAASEYYPAYSSDDAFIAFDRATTQGPNGMYYNPGSEVYVVPAGGAPAPTRLAANDPPACQGTPASPGVTNKLAQVGARRGVVPGREDLLLARLLIDARGAPLQERREQLQVGPRRTDLAALHHRRRRRRRRHEDLSGALHLEPGDTQRGSRWRPAEQSHADLGGREHPTSSASSIGWREWSPSGAGPRCWSPSSGSPAAA